MILRQKILIENKTELQGLKFIIFNLAVNLSISGWVMNQGKDVIVVEAQAEQKDLQAFHHSILSILEKEQDVVMTNIGVNITDNSSFRIG